MYIYQYRYHHHLAQIITHILSLSESLSHDPLTSRIVWMSFPASGRMRTFDPRPARVRRKISRTFSAKRLAEIGDQPFSEVTRINVFIKIPIRSEFYSDYNWYSNGFILNGQVWINNLYGFKYRKRISNTWINWLIYQVRFMTNFQFGYQFLEMLFDIFGVFIKYAETNLEYASTLNYIILSSNELCNI